MATKNVKQQSGGPNRAAILGGVALLAVVAVIVAVLVGSKDSDEKSGGGDLSGVQVKRELAGIPQSGIELGNPDAPVTLEEFADLQCPFCKQFADEALPKLIEDYVKPGKVKIVFHPLAILGPDSEKAALVAAQAAKQDKLWHFTELFYDNQKEENSGYVTDDFLKEIATGAGLKDVDQLVTDRENPEAADVVGQAQERASEFAIESTPSFVLGKTGKAGKKLDVQQLSAEEFTGPIDKLLGK